MSTNYTSILLLLNFLLLFYIQDVQDLNKLGTNTQKSGKILAVANTAAVNTIADFYS